ncbi:ABC transporter substrate binding protein [Brevibacillus ginsengisoli]|uniref:ABC transporter substrate binding protein n=1 Tax=Brevibacillus ginsengisoli TaxID=363854 RepID=UPI003CEA08FC
MRKSMSLFVCTLLTAFVLGGCGSANVQNSSQTTTAPTSQAHKVKLGLTQFVQHPALDSVHKGIVDGLAEDGFKDQDNLQIDFQNANGDMNNTVTIAQKFASDQDDAVVAITTPSAQAAAKAVTNTPVIFSTVTDPVSAQLVQSMDKPEGNITGTSDKVPMEKQLEVIQQMMPSIKKLGVLYTTSEVNSGVQVDELEKAAKAKGIQLVKTGISSQSEVQLATQSLVDQVDAILIPIDNTVVSAFDGVLMVAEKAKKPVFASDTDTVKRGAVATYGIDYYQMGKQTGHMVAKILKGQKVSNTPVEVCKETNLYINETAAAKFGLTVPDQLRKQAKEIFK